MARAPGRVRLARALRSAAAGGIHTLTIRKELRIGNPSERVHDLERRGFLITSTVEPRHGCHGARYVMARDAGDSMAWLTDSQLDADLGSGAPAGLSSPAAELSAERMATFRDYTDPDGRWMHVPLSEIPRAA